jgi:phosphinothricin acetyltransferase
MTIRLGTATDIESINRIGNQAIRDRFRVARSTELSLEERRQWFGKQDRDRYPVWVCEEDGNILGWLSMDPYREGRDLLDGTALISYFVDYHHQGKGIGSALIQHLLQHVPEGIRVVFAIIIDGNEGSIRLLKKFGFEDWARLPKVIAADNEFRDQVYLGKILR